MHFSEDNLRSALKRQEPGEPFTERVMLRIHQEEAKASSPRPARKTVPFFWRLLQLRAAIACVLVTALALAGWLGIARYRKAQERRAAEQAILALKITTSKLNYVLERVKSSPVREIKIRRESL